MKNYRIYVEKLPRFQVEAESMKRELNDNLGLGLTGFRWINVYDLFGFEESWWRSAATRSSVSARRTA